MSIVAPLPVTLSVNGSHLQLLCMWPPSSQPPPPSSPPPPPPSNSQDSQDPVASFQPWRPGDAYRSERTTCGTIDDGHISSEWNIPYLPHQILSSGSEPWPPWKSQHAGEIRSAMAEGCNNQNEQFQCFYLKPTIKKNDFLCFFSVKTTKWFFPQRFLR